MGVVSREEAQILRRRRALCSWWIKKLLKFGMREVLAS